MKMLIFSDSHGNINNMVKAIENNKGAVQGVIHLGDYTRDVIKLKEKYKDLHFEFVKGNNDWAETCLSENIINVNERKIFITHGHLYDVKRGYNKIAEKGKLLNVDAVLFGHTHVPFEQSIDNMVILNPGTIGYSTYNNSFTYCLATFSKDKIGFKFLSV